MNPLEFAAAVEACRKCPLGAARVDRGGKIVLLRGSWTASVVFIGEGPGREEDASGVPFVGPAGKLLDDVIAGLPIADEDWALVNLVKCQPWKNDLTKESIDACAPFLREQLAAIQPKLLVFLGKKAFESLANAGAAPPWHAFLGKLASYETLEGTIRFFAMHHPAATFYDPKAGEAFAREAEALWKAIDMLSRGWR